MVGFVNDAALQLHRGNGYTCILRIYEGSSEIQRTIIARAVLA
jgi:alkylation response protein AidB-like acyl-CoA dehydrogenase